MCYDVFNNIFYINYMSLNPDVLKQLQAPIPYKWRVQSFSKSSAKATCVAYIDARDVMNRLDEVFGLNWSDTYNLIDGKLFCTITVTHDGATTSRTDTGTESQTEKEKGQVSDAFKRAAVKFGVGRFLYDLDIVYVDSNEKKTASNYPFVIGQNGERVWDLTEYINSGKYRVKQANRPRETASKGASETRPWLDEEKYFAMLETIENGEGERVREAMKKYQIKKAYLDELNKKLK